jgi:hypothetical protein
MLCGGWIAKIRAAGLFGIDLFARFFPYAASLSRISE